MTKEERKARARKIAESFRLLANFFENDKVDVEFKGTSEVQVTPDGVARLNLEWMILKEGA